jgi:hypothetical protein
MKALRLLTICAFLSSSSILIASEHFDGTWHTRVVCPAKGKTEGFTWNFDSVIQDNNLRGVRGTEGQPGSFVLEGKLAADGSAKLSGSGIIASRAYARGVFARKGEEYTWDIKAQFRDSDGTGLRNEGLGIVGRPCTFEFTKREPAPAVPSQ